MWTSFPLSDVVTHLYYKGRFNYSKNNNLIKAREELSFSYKLCHKLSINRYRILLLLIPIEIMLGKLPNLDKLPPCFRDRFEPIIEALKTGNILLFKKAMEFYQDDFINCRIYLLMMKLDILVFRSLINKIHLVRKRMGNELKLQGNKPHIINLKLIKLAIEIKNKQYMKSKWYFKFDGKKDEEDEDDDIDMDEIECMMATLIFKKLVKGYVAHQNAVVYQQKLHFHQLGKFKIGINLTFEKLKMNVFIII